MEVRVTDHALCRWRQRAAQHADDDGKAVIAAFREAVLVPKDEPLPSPLRRKPRSRYFRHNSGVWFIAEQKSLKIVKIVTIVVPVVVSDDDILSDADKAKLVRALTDERRQLEIAIHKARRQRNGPELAGSLRATLQGVVERLRRLKK